MNENNPGFRRNILSGSLFSVIARWTVRLIGLVNTMIIARLLTPADFGIATMSVITVGLLTTLSELGVVNLVIRSQDRSEAFVRTGWTLQVLQGSVVGLLVVLGSPLAVRYFEEPRLEPVLYLAALTVFIAGFQSMGLALARKDLNYRADFRFLVLTRVMNFVCVVSLAVWLRSYWALVAGALLANTLTTLASFWLFPWLPRFQLVHYRPFLNFALAAIPMSMARFAIDRVGAIVVGGVGSSAQLGIYHVSSDLSQMATAEVVDPIGRVLIPNYAKLVDQPEKLAQSFLYSIQLILTIALPAAVGLSAVAEDFVLTLLGDQWQAAGDLVAWLALYFLASGVLQVLTTNILVAVGREHLASLLYWIRLAMLVPVMFYFGTYHGVMEMVMAATVAMVLMLPAALHITLRHLVLGGRQLLLGISRPVLAVLCMLAVLTLLPVVPPPGPLALLWQVLVGALSYGGGLLLSWYLVGRPEGVEASVVEMLTQRLR